MAIVELEVGGSFSGYPMMKYGIRSEMKNDNKRRKVSELIESGEKTCAIRIKS